MAVVLYRFINNALMLLHTWYLRRIVGNEIGRNTRISLRAYVDLTNPRGVHIGEGTRIETGATVLAHDPSHYFHAHTFVGRNCFIGMHAIVMPGIVIGDQSIVIPGSVVKASVPAGSIVAGNPARIVRLGIRTGKFGVVLDGDVDEAMRIGGKTVF